MNGASTLAGARAWAITSSQCPSVPNSATPTSSAQWRQARRARPDPGQERRHQREAREPRVEHRRGGRIVGRELARDDRVEGVDHDVGDAEQSGRMHRRRRPAARSPARRGSRRRSPPAAPATTIRRAAARRAAPRSAARRTGSRSSRRAAGSAGPGSSAPWRRTAAASARSAASGAGSCTTPGRAHRVDEQRDHARRSRRSA